MTDVKLKCLCLIATLKPSMCKQIAFDSLTMFRTKYLFTNHIFNIHLHKENLTLDKVQGSKWHKTQTTNQSI